MNIKSIVKVCATIVDPIMYFVLCRLLSAFFFETKAQDVLKPSFLFPIVIGMTMLWYITYLGPWLILSERKHDIFWKTFVFLNILPGILGVASQFLYQT